MDEGAILIDDCVLCKHFPACERDVDIFSYADCDGQGLWQECSFIQHLVSIYLIFVTLSGPAVEFSKDITASFPFDLGGMVVGCIRADRQALGVGQGEVTAHTQGTAGAGCNNVLPGGPVTTDTMEGGV